MAFPALSSRKTAISAALTAVLTTGVIAYAAYSPAESEVLPAPAAAASAQAPAAAPVAAAPHQQRTKEQAAAALMALPELQAWSALLEKESHGKAHGALIEYDPAPRKIRGKSYWQFSFVENRPDAVHRRASFLVAKNGKDVLFEDPATDQLLSLPEWRRTIRKVEAP